jgi:hypothetical protein
LSKLHAKDQNRNICDHSRHFERDLDDCHHGKGWDVNKVSEEEDWFCMNFGFGEMWETMKLWNRMRLETWKWSDWPEGMDDIHCFMEEHDECVSKVLIVWRYWHFWSWIELNWSWNWNWNWNWNWDKREIIRSKRENHKMRIEFVRIESEWMHSSHYSLRSASCLDLQCR